MQNADVLDFGTSTFGGVLAVSFKVDVCALASATLSGMIVSGPMRSIGMGSTAARAVVARRPTMPLPDHRPAGLHARPQDPQHWRRTDLAGCA